MARAFTALGLFVATLMHGGPLVKAAPLWHTYSYITLDVPFVPQGSTFPYTGSPAGLNSRGDVVGYWYSGVDHNTHGYVYRDGAFTNIDAPFDGAGNTRLTGINDWGDIVGTYEVGIHTFGFLYDGSVFTTLDLNGGVPTSINNQGQIVGYVVGATTVHGLLYDRGTVTIFDIPGHAKTSATDINNGGNMIGYYQDGFIHGSFLMDRAGTLTLLNAPFSSPADTTATGINSSKQIVGSYMAWESGRPIGLHAFLYDAGEFVSIDGPPGTRELEFGRINERGQIIGLLTDAANVHGFLATPLRK
jgi:hypothetical protein